MFKNLVLEKVFKNLIVNEYDVDGSMLSIVKDKELINDYKDMLEFLNDDVCFVNDDNEFNIIDGKLVVSNNNYELIVFSYDVYNRNKFFVVIEDDRVLIGYIDICKDDVKVSKEISFNCILNNIK